MKLSKRAGKRYDEVLEEDSANNEKNIDIIGEPNDKVKPAKEKEGECKAVKNGLYGPEQFSEEDLLAVRAGSEEWRGEETGSDPSRWCSQCQVLPSVDWEIDHILLLTWIVPAWVMFRRGLSQSS